MKSIVITIALCCSLVFSLFCFAADVAATETVEVLVLTTSKNNEFTFGESEFLDVKAELCQDKTCKAAEVKVTQNLEVFIFQELKKGIYRFSKATNSALSRDVSTIVTFYSDELNSIEKKITVTKNKTVAAAGYVYKPASKSVVRKYRKLVAKSRRQRLTSREKVLLRTYAKRIRRKSVAPKSNTNFAKAAEPVPVALQPASEPRITKPAPVVAKVAPVQLSETPQVRKFSPMPVVSTPNTPAKTVQIPTAMLTLPSDGKKVKEFDSEAVWGIVTQFGFSLAWLIFIGVLYSSHKEIKYPFLYLGIYIVLGLGYVVVLLSFDSLWAFVISLGFAVPLYFYWTVRGTLHLLIRRKKYYNSIVMSDFRKKEWEQGIYLRYFKKPIDPKWDWMKATCMNFFSLFRRSKKRWPQIGTFCILCIIYIINCHIIIHAQEASRSSPEKFVTSYQIRFNTDLFHPGNSFAVRGTVVKRPARSDFYSRNREWQFGEDMINIGRKYQVQIFSVGSRVVEIWSQTGLSKDNYVDLVSEVNRAIKKAQPTATARAPAERHFANKN